MKNGVQDVTVGVADPDHPFWQDGTNIHRHSLCRGIHDLGKRGVGGAHIARHKGIRIASMLSNKSQHRILLKSRPTRPWRTKYVVVFLIVAHLILVVVVDVVVIIVFNTTSPLHLSLVSALQPLASPFLWGRGGRTKSKVRNIHLARRRHGLKKKVGARGGGAIGGWKKSVE